jgi:predicted dienelactone hydrolase
MIVSMDSTLRHAALSALLLVASLGAAAYNHELEVAPLAPGPFAVACSNIEHDTARMAQLGGVPSDYWEGHTVGGEQRYITDILAHPDTAIVFNAQVPFKPQLYFTRFLQRVPFAALVCHPTPRSNDDASYSIPGAGGVVPHMQRPGAAPQLISSVEYAQTLGISTSGTSTSPAKLPFIVYSHGLGGSPLGKGYIDVMVQLAAQGYMVAAVFHADARFSLIRVEDFGDLVYTLAFFPLIVEMEAMRPLALKVMTDRMLESSGFSPGIDTDRIGGFGASLGGQAMANLLGARLTSSLAMSCDETVRDPRIRAAVGYVPYSGQSFLPAFCNDQEGAAGVNRPYLAISGTADTTAPIKLTQQAVNRFGDSRYLVQLDGGEHELRPEDAGDVLTWMVTFLDAYLDVRRDVSMARFIRMRSVRGGRPDSLIVDVHVPFANVGAESRVVEFYNTGLNHFFLTASPSDIDIIHAGGAGPGWIETGHAFKAWLTPSAESAAGGAVDVCRFYGGYNGGPNSHFFTAIKSDCELVKTSYPGWTYEGIAFQVRPPVDGACPLGYLGVNRAYNNGYVRNDSNHRFTTSDSEIKALTRLGWTYEGIAMCSRPLFGVSPRSRLVKSGSAPECSPSGLWGAHSGPIGWSGRPSRMIDGPPGLTNTPWLPIPVPSPPPCSARARTCAPPCVRRAWRSSSTASSTSTPSCAPASAPSARSPSSPGISTAAWCCATRRTARRT